VALCDAGHAGHDLPGRAIAALEGIPLNERHLQRVELIALRQALDCRDLAAVHKDREGEARFDALAVHQHRASAALAKATSFLRTRQMQVLAQGIEEGCAWVERQPMLSSVDAQQDV
jgi:hypothetical protein